MTDPWIVKAAKPAFAPLPVGSYSAAFQGVEEVTLPSGESKWRFAWEVTTGEYKGKAATALTNKSISPTALPGVIIAGLLGRELVAGESVKAAVNSCVGKIYLVSILPGPRGGKPCVRMVATLPQM